MTSRLLALAVAVVLGPWCSAVAQDPTRLAAAEAAWQDLAYDSVLAAASAALDGRLTRPERVRAQELLAFAYAALDSTDRAIDAFRQVVYLDPDREYDPERVSPGFVQLYRIALGRELVVRRLTLDSTTFVAGRGTALLRFEASRPAEYAVRVVGRGVDSIVARGSTPGPTVIPWSALSERGPVPPGPYDVTVTVSQFEDRYARPLRVTVRHGEVDTLSHLSRIEGLDELPETEVQPRNWAPLALTALAAGVVTGAVLAMESGSPSGTRTELLTFDLLALGTGAVLSLRQPPPRPLPSNIEFNRRVRQMVAQRNAEIATGNAERRRMVRLTIAVEPGTVP